jgi:Transposase DDE domain
MFLRRCLRRKRGKVHTYWALVESYRTKKGSRQRVVTYLGELKASERSGWAELGRRLDHRERPQPTLFDPPAQEEAPDHEPVLVRLKGVRLERKRDFGEVWLALGLWRLVGLDVVLQRLLPQGREQVPWPLVAAILVIARFCRPSSELHIEHTWYRGTALEELLGVPIPKVHTDRLYEGLDVILPHKAALEKHLKERLGNLFDLHYELLLYDVTSTYFEGQCQGNPQAKRGHSRDSRPDCPQVCIGLVVTEEGIPLGYEVFAGNTHDSKTIPHIVAAMETKYGKAQRIWVLDRGMVSEGNLKFLRDRGGKYIVGTPKATLRKFEKALTEGAWHTVQEGVEVKLANGPQGEETFVLARSADRREKEKAMHQRFLERLEAGLNKLRVAAESGRLRDPAVANRRLGRLLQRYQRAAGAFDVKIDPLPASAEAQQLPASAETQQLPASAEAQQLPASAEAQQLPASAEAQPLPASAEAQQLPASAETQPLPASAEAKLPGRKKEKKAPSLAVTWTRAVSWHSWAELSEGCYLLRTNLVDVDASTLWKRYIQLTDAEWAFRIHKDELAIRPIWHQTEKRVQAHILVCFLAYVLWKTLSQWMQRSGLGDAPRTLLSELAKIQSADVVLPTQGADGQAGRVVRLRCVTTPEPEQKVLLNRLGITLPTRLRTLEEPTPTL